MPSKAGVYRFLDAGNIVLYVGKANDLKARVSSYYINKDLGDKTRVLVSQIKKIKITVVESELEALLLEAYYIKKYQPKYNITLRDNKSYIRIKITIKDKYPSITLARLEQDSKAIYFGPYPSTSSVRLVLKTIRRVFPYVSALNHSKRICLYNHLGLCPCPQVFDSVEAAKDYKKTIRNIIRILEGQSRKIMGELEKERDKLSKYENFEEALKIQKKIDALGLITTPIHTPFEYDTNPNLRADLRQQELNGLMEALNQTHKIPTAQNIQESTLLPDAAKIPRPSDTPFNKGGLGDWSWGDMKKLNRIECYDISNTQGTNATGSMVVFINGEKEGSQYRKFKIRISGKPNDFAMMQEVITRRLKHTEWDLPDLIIVDGGKGQVSAALKVLQENNMNIPLIGLAKREETIIVPVIARIRRMEETKQSLLKEKLTNNRAGLPRSLRSLAMTKEGEHYQEISLPKSSPSLHLIMRIRDEAHRFAITYHKKLRSKSALSSIL